MYLINSDRFFSHNILDHSEIHLSTFQSNEVFILSLQVLSTCSIKEVIDFFESNFSFSGSKPFTLQRVNPRSAAIVESYSSVSIGED
jgi:hypothetical protein